MAKIEAAHLNTYANIIQLLLQDRGRKLSPGINIRSYTGKGVRVVDQVDVVEATEIIGRHTDTEITDPDQTARWAFPRDWGVASMIDKEDLIRMMTDPQSEFAEAQMKSIGRKHDDAVIDAFFTDTAKVGQDGTETITFSADGGTQVAAGGVGMTVAKLRAAKKALMANEVDIDNDELWCGLTAEQHDDLLTETQAINLDYTNKPVLVEGAITSFMGFRFLHSERFTVDGSADRRCPAWAKSGMVLGLWNAIETDVSKRADKWNNLQIMAKSTFGATRTEGKKIVEILCVE